MLEEFRDRIVDKDPDGAVGGGCYETLTAVEG